MVCVRYTKASRRWEKAARRAKRDPPLARETEIKVKIADVRAFHRMLKRIGARLVGPGIGRVHEENVIFDTPQGGLAKHGQLLRIRTETPEVHRKSKAARLKQPVVPPSNHRITPPPHPNPSKPPFRP